MDWEVARIRLNDMYKCMIELNVFILIVCWGVMGNDDVVPGLV